MLTTVACYVYDHHENKALPSLALTGSLDIDYKPTKEELWKLIDGLRMAGRIFLAAGAQRVMPTTLRYHEFRSEPELEQLDQLVKDNSKRLSTKAKVASKPLS